jgi:Trypsin-co-occurring domain 1
VVGRGGGALPQMVEFPLKGSDATVVVAVQDPVDIESGGPVYRGGLARDLIERSSRTLDDAISQVKPAAVALVTTLTDLPKRPDELTVTFGIGLSGAAGAFIASTAATANITITLTWKAPQ